MMCLFFHQVTRGLVARFLQRSKRNLSLSSDHPGSGGQGPKRRSVAEGTAAYNLPSEQVWQDQFQPLCNLLLQRLCDYPLHHYQVLLTPWNATRRHPNNHPNHPQRRGHHHSHSDSRHNRHHDSWLPEGMHLRSCGDLSSSSSASLRLLLAPPHGSSGALYSESALWGGEEWQWEKVKGHERRPNKTDISGHILMVVCLRTRSLCFLTKWCKHSNAAVLFICLETRLEIRQCNRHQRQRGPCSK